MDNDGKCIWTIFSEEKKYKSSSYVAKLQSYSHRRQEDHWKRGKQMDMLIMWKRRSCQGKHTTNLFQHLHEHRPLIFIKLALSQSSSKSKPTEFDTSSKQATLAANNCKLCKIFVR